MNSKQMSLLYELHNEMLEELRDDGGGSSHWINLLRKALDYRLIPKNWDGSGVEEFWIYPQNI